MTDGSIKKSTPGYEAAYQDLVALLMKHAELTPPELLAISANLVGKLIAMQDQRTMTRDEALEIVMRNIEIGNGQAIAIVSKTKGNA